MEIEQKTIEWFESSVAKFDAKDVEFEDARGPIKELSILRDKSGVTVKLVLPWMAMYQGDQWQVFRERTVFQLLDPRIELVDEKVVRLTSSDFYCVIFFGYQNIEPVGKPA